MAVKSPLSFFSTSRNFLEFHCLPAFPIPSHSSDVLPFAENETFRSEPHTPAGVRSMQSTSRTLAKISLLHCNWVDVSANKINEIKAPLIESFSQSNSATCLCCYPGLFAAF